MMRHALVLGLFAMLGACSSAQSARPGNDAGASGGATGGSGGAAGSTGGGGVAGTAGATGGAGGAIGGSAGADPSGTDAAAGDDARRDASSVDRTGEAPSGAGGARGPCGGIFCEDFESGSFNPAVWTVSASGGQTASVQRTVVAHGSYAAQFHANPNVVSYDFIVARNVPAALRGHHFGRAYFHVTPKPPAAHTEFLFAGSGGFPKDRYLEVAGINAGFQLTFVNLGPTIGSGTQEVYSPGGTLPVAKWICLEWEMNDTPDQITVFVDGKQQHAFDPITFMGVSSGLVGPFAEVGFGYYAWHPATYAFDIYYDDIVLDTQRVGCLP